MPRTSEPPPLLLDTHIWLWLAEGTDPLSPGTRETIGVAASGGKLKVAAMSIWEVALLASRNRIVLGKPTTEWVEQALLAPGLTLEPLSPRIAIESCHLPAGFRSDPADHFIVATARVTNAILMTRDRLILDYAAQGHLTALSA
jgi:PIN domain nuclease of toxin-antitoxin system